MIAMREDVMIPYLEDGYDFLRKAYNDVMEEKILEGKQGIEQELYLTVTIERKNFEEAKAQFATIEAKEALRDRILTIIERNQFTLSDELDADAHDLLTRFCGEYNVDCQMSERNNIAISKETLNDNTKVFIKELKKCKNKKGLEGLYGQLRDYNRKIKLTTDETWKLLVDKTKAICGDFDFMFEYFSKSSYPDTEFYSSNSRYMYMGLGYVIESGVDKNKLYNFIVENGGHDGFLQLLYAYAFIEDESMCRKLFKRFMEICRFLVIA